jgi:GMP synthase-like glutamine amidotransferase
VRALVIANGDDADPGVVGERLRDHGFVLSTAAREEPGAWPALEGLDLVLLLGSDWSVYWDHVAPSVEAEVALVRRAHESGVPILGICYGAQVVARALGGNAERGAREQIGWCTVDSDVPELASGPWMQWHYDVCTVPPGAVELARDELCPQAFQLGRTLATQFHPEVTPSIVARWSSGAGEAELAAIDRSAQELLAETRSHAARAHGDAVRLIDWSLDEVFVC